MANWTVFSMNSNINKLYDLIRKRGYKAEVDVREYFGKKGVDNDVVNEIVEKLIGDDLIKRSFFQSAYKKAIAQFFQTRQPMSRQAVRMEMSFKMEWFTPDDAMQFIEYCERDGLIEERDGKIHPTFDVSEVELPFDWTIHKELNIKTGGQIAQERTKERSHRREVDFVQEERKTETAQMLVEDGMSVDDGGVVIDGEKHMTVMSRPDDKRAVVRKLVGVGLSGKVANGLFDYYELNVGMIGEEQFVFTGARFEGEKDEKKLAKAYAILFREGCFGFEIRAA